MDVACNNYSCGVLMGIFFFSHSFCIYYLELLTEEEFSLLSHVFIDLIMYLYQCEILGILSVGL